MQSSTFVLLRDPEEHVFSREGHEGCFITVSLRLSHGRRGGEVNKQRVSELREENRSFEHEFDMDRVDEQWETEEGSRRCLCRRHSARQPNGERD